MRLLVLIFALLLSGCATPPWMIPAEAPAPERPSPAICAKAPPVPVEPHGSLMNSVAASYVAELISRGERGWRIIEREREARCQTSDE